MEVLNEKTPSLGKSKRFRLVVRSAEEAVRVIRDKLGEHARVLSVRQIGGEGLKKFISSPKLEVIAELPTEESLTVGETEQELDAISNTTSKIEESHTANGNKILESTNAVDDRKLENVEKNNSELNSFDVLLKAGFDSQLLSLIESWSNWNDIKDLSLADTLKEITIGLSDRFKLSDSIPVSDRIAIIGAPRLARQQLYANFSLMMFL